MAYTANTHNLLEPIYISISIQYHWIIVGFICQERTQWSQDSSTGPHTHPDNPLSVTGHLIPRIVDDVIDNKNQYRNHHRHSQASFTDNSSEWRTNKEEDETCQRKSQFLMPGSHVPSKAAFSLRYIKALKTPVTPRTLCTVDGRGYNLLFLHQCSHIVEAVYIVLT